MKLKLITNYLKGNKILLVIVTPEWIWGSENSFQFSLMTVSALSLPLAKTI
jgi:hypothetical protein